MNPQPLDQIRLARRSRHCFVLGVIGIVPFLGLPAAIESIHVFGATKTETGETWKHTPFVLAFIAAWAWLPASYMLWGSAWMMAIFYFETALLGWFFSRMYRTRSRPNTNPATLWLHWGLALAYAQIFMLGALPTFAWAFVFHNRGIH